MSSLSGRAKDARANLFFDQCREPALHEIELGGGARSEVHMRARMPDQPTMDEICFARVVSCPRSDVRPVRWERLLRCAQEFTKFDRAVPGMEISHDASALYP